MEELAGSSPFNDKYFLSLNSVKNLLRTPVLQFSYCEVIECDPYSMRIGKRRA